MGPFDREYAPVAQAASNANSECAVTSDVPTAVVTVTGTTPAAWAGLVAVMPPYPSCANGTLTPPKATLVTAGSPMPWRWTVVPPEDGPPAGWTEKEGTPGTEPVYVNVVAVGMVW